jgi:hypothetical protein
VSEKSRLCVFFGIEVDSKLASAFDYCFSVATDTLFAQNE